MVKSRQSHISGTHLRCSIILTAACCTLFVAAPVSMAQDALSEQAMMIKAPNAVAKIGTDLFGDSVNLYQGRLNFRQTDVSVPGNSAIPVAVGRHFNSAKNIYTNSAQFAFGRWELDVAYMSGTYSSAEGWTVHPTANANEYARCSEFGEPNPVSVSGGIFDGADFWSGSSMYVPGHGEQQLLRRDESKYTDAPNSDPASYPVVTSNKWAISCLPNLANDPGGTLGQGFLAVSPDGVKYRFDQMVTVPMWSTTKPLNSSAATVPGTETAEEGSAPASAAAKPGDPNPLAPDTATLPRKEVRLMVTLITDRFGNWVRYNYDPARPANVTSITSSDNRTLTFTYANASYPQLITSVTDGVRTWTYGYSGFDLATVTLPDQSTWNFTNFYPLAQTLTPVSNSVCGAQNGLTGANVTGSIVHPSGATGTFTLQATAHGRSDVPNICRQLPNGSYYPGLPLQFVTYSLKTKTITGPGMAAMTWNYAYGPANASFAPCTGACPITKTATMTDPKGHVTRYTFGNRYRVSEGRIEQVDSGWNGSTALSTTTTRYRPAGAGPYPSVYGYGGEAQTDGEVLSRPMPADLKITTQQGATFTWEADSFDTGVRVTAATKSSSLGMSRTETTAYSDNVALWVLDQVASVTESSTGKKMVETTYNSFAMPATKKKFGLLIETLGYAANGTLQTKTDGKSQTTTFTNYKYGIPGNISYHNGSSQSAVVVNPGYINSLTNAAQFTTGFAYDAMGRLSGVTHPTGGPVAWSGTTVLTARVATSEYGITGAHWRQTVSTGNARAVTYYDGLLRPVLSRTYDNAAVAATIRVVVKNYDHHSNTTFESYPQRDITTIATPGNGTTFNFDALNRPTTVVAASELGNLTTTHTYGSPFTTTVTNPRSKSTTYTYYAWDAPTTDLIKSADLPVNVTIDIARNNFGATTSIVRADTTQSATRSYVYDGYERLCKTIEPETGSTVQDYDLASNVAWRASGLALPSTSTCDTASVPANRKAVFNYDGLNRLTTTTFGDGSPSIGRTYTNDSLPLTISSNGSVWTNTYNNRRLIERESLVYAGSTYNIDRLYNANASLSRLTYPDLAFVDYAPNALGEATKVGTYATGVTYHPNGAVAAFTYGNGIAHSTLQNMRGLPSYSGDGTILKDRYTYDQNANVASILDEVSPSVSGRTMGYDDLDRLLTVAAPGMWGTATYTYDALDNLRSAQITAGATVRSTVHNINSTTNRLSSITNGPAAYNFTFGYDLQGNITQRGAQFYVFDIANRMSSATGKATYVYDGLGRRFSVVGTDGVNRVQVYSQQGQILYMRGTAVPLTAGTKYIYLNRHQIAEVKAAGAN